MNDSKPSIREQTETEWVLAEISEHLPRTLEEITTRVGTMTKSRVQTILNELRHGEKLIVHPRTTDSCFTKRP